MALAYVIMPYAKEFDRVYRNLIKPAVEACGLECRRTDKDMRGGNVMQNVIRDLAQAKIVIADISTRRNPDYPDLQEYNWNVAYELGVRHALSKRGTVILCNEDTALPYDITGYDVILYPRDWLDKDLDDEIIDKIISRINVTMSSEVVSDGPVHDNFTTLPENLLQFLNTSDDNEQKQIKELRAQLEELREKNHSLQELVDQAGLDSQRTKVKTENTETLILKAIENSKYNGDTAVNTMREFLRDGKTEEFARFLAKVLDCGYLDETDCKIIYSMCRGLDNPTIVRIFLERAVEFYPDSEELQGFLADTYSDDYRTRDKALSMANSMIGLTKRNGKYELQQKVRSARMLASFFNVYHSLKMYKDIIDVGHQLLDLSPNNRSLILRNIIHAYRCLEMYDLAQEYARTLIAEDPMDDRNHSAAFNLQYSLHRYEAAYRELEKCIACDSDDTDYYRQMAAIICDERIARSSSGEYIQINKTEKQQYAVPFLIRAIMIDDKFLNDAVAFMRNNNFRSTLQQLVHVLQSGGSMEKEFANLDYSAVDMCADVDCTTWEDE